jgi:cytochrome c-type biogenesis protein CcmH
MRRARFEALLAALLGALSLAAASDPADRLKDPAQEAHARALFRQIRCLVCQNESIDDSEAPLAHDLRQIVREQVREGRSDADIKAFLVGRYGQFVLLRPAFSLGNAPLWLLPPLLLLSAAAWIANRAARSRKPLDEPLSAEEEARLVALAAARGEPATLSPQGRRTKSTVT